MNQEELNKQQQEVINNMLKNQEGKLRQEQTTQDSNTIVPTKHDMLTEQGMSLVLCIVVLLLVKVFIRRKILNKVLSIACIYGVYMSVVSYLGMKFNSKILSILANILVVGLIILYIKFKRKKGVKKSEG